MNFIKKKNILISLAVGLSLFCLLVLGISFYQPKPSYTISSQLIVILGAGYFPTGQPVPALEKRLDKGVELWSKNQSDSIYIMISGREEEVTIMKNYLLEKGIPKSHLVEDREGVNTRATVHNAYRYAKKYNTDPLFVSQAYHLPRIYLYALSYGKAEYRATDRVSIAWISLFPVASRELLAILAIPFAS